MVYDVLPQTGDFCGRGFVFPVRVYYEDTDAGGIVYYANYLKFAERARTEFLRKVCDSCQQEILEEEKCGFTVRHIEVDYKKPAVLDDALTVSVVVEEAKGASASICQQIFRENQLLVEIKVKLAYVNLSKKKPVRIPAEIVEKINLSVA